MYRIIIISFTFFLAACSLKDPAARESANSEGNAIELLLDSACVAEYDLYTGSSIRDFYKRINYKTVWIDQGTFKPAADSLFRFIQCAAYHGLSPGDYHLKLITAILKEPYTEISASTIDVLFTDAFFTMYFHLKHGRLVKTSLKRITSFPVDPVNFGLLINAVQNNSVATLLIGQEPQHKEYKLLKKELAARLNILSGNGYQKVLVGKRPGSLKMEIEIISLNMERWRWETYPLPDRLVKVNIPLYELQVLDCDSIALSSKVVVGARETPTPVLESLIECFTIYPYWHVPRKISVNELLPIIQKDTAYLRRNSFDVLDKKGKIVDSRTIAWKRLHADYFPYVLRQREGEENSLGIIKFRFDNPYAVYLHDTNAKRHFKQKDRALSHGCVRVEEAVGLAHYLVKGDSINFSSEDLDQYLSLKEQKEIDLMFPIPIHIKYFTYKVDNGELTFLEDVYKRDSVMVAALRKNDNSTSPSSRQLTFREFIGPKLDQ